jgi:GR25 family glycosyltransferase involved in LPS biosynthesis
MKLFQKQPFYRGYKLITDYNDTYVNKYNTIRNYNANQIINHQIVNHQIVNNTLIESVLKNNNIKHVLLINMRKRQDRLLLMKYKLNDIGIKFTLIEGVDGSIEPYKSMYNTYLNNYTDYKKHNPSYNKLPINSCGAYGILLTYKKICNLLTLNNSSNIMILEDDIMFHNDFLNKLQSNIHHLNTNSILYLGANQSRFHADMINQMQDGYYNISNIRYFWTYGAYGVILKPIMFNHIRMQLQNMVSPLLTNIDMLIWYILQENNKLTGLVIYPNLIIPQVEESDNMGHRNIIELAKDKMWNLDEYKYVHLTSYFKDIYASVTSGKISLRASSKQISQSLDNVSISRIIENGNKSFVFIIPSFNNRLYYKKNLESVFAQKYKFFRVIYIDDASTDDTYELVTKYITDNSYSDKTTILRNDKNYKQSYSRYRAFQLCQDDEICCMLDGDDWLYDENVLSKLNATYKENNLLVSYGQFYYYYDNRIQGKSGVGKITDLTNYRTMPFIPQHLRSCEASLLKTITLDYIKFNGEYLKCCSDCAEMWWVLERSNGRHMNVGYPTLIYNKGAALTYENSYYNTDKNEYWKKYREDVLCYLQTYNSSKTSD